MTPAPPVPDDHVEMTFLRRIKREERKGFSNRKLLLGNSLVEARGVSQESGFTYAAAGRCNDHTQQSHPLGIGKTDEQEASSREGNCQSNTYTERNECKLYEFEADLKLT